jgi:hypothetical protein
MAQSKIGEVTTPTGGINYVYWDTSTGQVYVASEYAGVATTKDEAMRKANFYATTGQLMK